MRVRVGVRVRVRVRVRVGVRVRLSYLFNEYKADVQFHPRPQP